MAAVTPVGRSPNMLPIQLALRILLDFRDRYGLLDHLNSNGFDYWSDRLLHFPRSFLPWRTFGLGNHLRLRSFARPSAFS